MANFGRYLLDKGVLDLAQLEEATHVMVVFGGRLGTILVEAGFLTMEQVEKHLSGYLDVPSAPLERLQLPEPEALATIPSDMARRHSVLPLWIEKRTLHLAMLDARDPNLIDALAFATDLAIAPYVVSERRLVDLLERHYGIRPDSRFTDYRILELAGHYRPGRLPGMDELEPASAPEAAASGKAEPDALTRERAALGITPLADDEELGDPSHAMPQPTPCEALLPEPIELTLEVSPPDDPELRVRPARDHSELAGLEAELVFLSQRDRIAPLTLRIATTFVRSAALFVVRGPVIQGVLAGGEVHTDRIDGMFLPLEAESILARAAGPAGRFRGRPPTGRLDERLLQSLRPGTPREIAVLPIRLAERTVNLLYADNGDDALPETSLAALEALGDVVSAAYRRLILEGRRLLR